MRAGVVHHLVLYIQDDLLPLLTVLGVLHFVDSGMHDLVARGVFWRDVIQANRNTFGCRNLVAQLLQSADDPDVRTRVLFRQSGQRLVQRRLAEGLRRAVTLGQDVVNEKLT